MFRKQTNVVPLPDRATASAAYRRVLDRIAGIEAQVRDIDEAAWRASESGETSRIDALALAMIHGGEIPGAPQGTAARRAELVSELQIARRAAELARADVVRVAKSEAGRIAAELRPSHRKAVERIARALAELSAALDAEAAIRAKVPGHAHLPNASFPNVGSLSRIDSPASYWMKRMRQIGGLDVLPAAAE